MSEPETYYEMLWDCAVCNTKGLLGTSHRHCPMCGAGQDPTQRYFPPPGQEVEAKNHIYAGIDWNCAYCQSANSAAAKYCVNCGAGQDGAKPVSVKVEGDVDVEAEAAPEAIQPLLAAAPSRRRHWPWVAGAVALLLGIVASLIFSTTETSVEVTGHSWERRIAIERFSAVSEQAWCDSLPAGAYALSRSREVRSQRQVPAGQDCSETRVDKGDGSFVKKQECRPRYRDEPVYDERCRFRVNRWQVARWVQADQTTSNQLLWPSAGYLSGGNGLGAEREGERKERYTLKLAGDGKIWQCDVDAARWQRLRDGSQASLAVRLSGGADCASLH